MRIFTPNNPGDYLSVLTEFEEEEGNSVLKNDMFSAITMSFDVAESICSRTDDDNRSKLLSYHQNRITRFENSLQNYYFTEIVPIPDLRAIQSGKVMTSFPTMFTHAPLFYTPKEFSKHLQNIIKLLQTFDTYNVHLIPTSQIDGCSVYCKEDVGVIIEKSTPPAITFAINESNMNAAFWDYMRLMLNKQPRDKTQRSITIDTINTIAETLKDL